MICITVISFAMWLFRGAEGSIRIHSHVLGLRRGLNLTCLDLAERPACPQEEKFGKVNPITVT